MADSRAKGGREHRLDLFLSDPEMARVEALAARDGVSKSEAIRALIRRTRVNTERTSQNRPAQSE